MPAAPFTSASDDTLIGEVCRLGSAAETDQTMLIVRLTGVSDFPSLDQ
jgi:hypothetical protein